MSEWRKVRVDEIAEKIAIGPFGSRMKSDTYTEIGVPVIRGTNLTGGRSFSGEWVYISEEDADQLASCNVTEGDLVFPHRGAIGEVGIVPGDRDRYLLSSSLMKLKCDPKKAHSLYLFYFFKSHEGRHQLLKNASQVGTPGIGQPLSSLKSIELELPPLSNQRAIAHILGTLDDKIELNRRMNETLEAIARALFKSWFVDFDPVRAKMSGEPPESICQRLGLTPDLLALFPDRLVDSELGEIPEGWNAISLDRKLVPTKGKNITKSTAVGGEVPVVAGGLTPAYYHNASNVDGPAITISASGANAGFVNLYHQNIWASDCSYVNKVHTKFVYLFYLFFKSRQDEITHMQQGAAQPHVYPKDLIRLKLVDPTLNVWGYVENVVTPIFLMMKNNIEEMQSLSELRDTLLLKLLSGELRVPDAANRIEEIA